MLYILPVGQAVDGKTLYFCFESNVFKTKAGKSSIYAGFRNCIRGSVSSAPTRKCRFQNTKHCVLGFFILFKDRQSGKKLPDRRIERRNRW